METFALGGLDSSWVQVHSEPDELAREGLFYLPLYFLRRRRRAVTPRLIVKGANHNDLAAHEKFDFKTLEAVKAKAQELGAGLSFRDGSEPAVPAQRRWADAPRPIPWPSCRWKGCDSNTDGSPSELVERRYLRFASGGAGLLWWEACAVVPEGRANELQMMLTASNRSKFAELLQKTNAAAAQKNGAEHKPVNILQLTHSGRYSRPEGHIAPSAGSAARPASGQRRGSRGHRRCTSTRSPSAMYRARCWHEEVGFDGVDIKSCHRYLLSELLASHTREGKYGGSFENRTRFLRQTIQAVREAVGDDFIVACRFNVFDAHPYPYGFGCDHEDMWKFDPTEPVALVKMMVENGVDLLSNSGGNPYYIYPQVTRPFRQIQLWHPHAGGASAGEHGAAVRLHPHGPAGRGQTCPWWATATPGCASSCPMWARPTWPTAAAALWGLGRDSFAYPDAPHGPDDQGRHGPGQVLRHLQHVHPDHAGPRPHGLRHQGRRHCTRPCLRRYNAEAVAREHRK